MPHLCPDNKGGLFSESIFIFCRIILRISRNLLETMVQSVPALRAFWDLKKTELYEIRVSGTVVGLLLTRKSPTCT